ncbi:MAG TPA: M15 family metallopeptidase [Steroidobacteraceae bacterium]|nr:M15 family metallopeptidase [Steroidobacteraceae bacterium]
MTATPVFGPLELTGRTRRHIVELADPQCALHRSVVMPFLAMRAAAARADIDLAPASAFRDFELQVRIWNEKWLGRRALLDRAGRRLDDSALTPAGRVAAILTWSAPPGASRHHWGTEIDVFDRAALPAGHRPGLVAAEYAPGGPFARLTAWLDAHMGRFGFYRPYVTDRGGVAPEPWHLSHAPTSREASRRLRLATVRAAIRSGEIEGKAALLKALPQIYARYVRAVDSPRRLSR